MNGIAIWSAGGALAFVGYLSAFVDLPAVPLAAALVAVTSLVDFWGIDLSTEANVLFTAIEVVGLLVIVYTGAGSWEGRPSVSRARRPLRRHPRLVLRPNSNRARRPVGLARTSIDTRQYSGGA